MKALPPRHTLARCAEHYLFTHLFTPFVIYNFYQLSSSKLLSFYSTLHDLLREMKRTLREHDGGGISPESAGRPGTAAVAAVPPMPCHVSKQDQQEVLAWVPRGDVTGTAGRRSSGLVTHTRARATEKTIPPPGRDGKSGTKNRNEIMKCSNGSNGCDGHKDEPDLSCAILAPPTAEPIPRHARSFGRCFCASGESHVRRTN